MITPRQLHAQIMAQRPPWTVKLAAQLAPTQPPWATLCVQCRQDWNAGRNEHNAGYQGWRDPELIDWWIAEHKRYTGHRDVELVDWPDGWSPNTRVEMQPDGTVGE